MPSLGETTALLARLKRQADSFAPSLGGGEDAMVETSAFGANPGALRMFSYVPDNLPSGAPLVVVLHGCTQSAAGYASAAGWLTLADRYGFAVVAPEQTSANNANRCFNWFEPGDTARGKGEAASIRAMAAHAIAEHGLDASRVFVTGLSAGGAMTAVMLATYPDVFAGGAVVAGLPYGAADSIPAAFGAMHRPQSHTGEELAGRVRRAAPRGAPAPRLAIWQGDADHTVAAANAGELAKQWAALHGLKAEADEVQTLTGRSRAVWRSPTGEVLIESNLLQGLGHGTPLAASGPDGIGSVAPFMLEAGVSSSLEIARFWGVAPAGEPLPRAPDAAQQKPKQNPAPTPQAGHGDGRGHGHGLGLGLGEQVMASVSPHIPADIQKVIAKALKGAGLMK